MFRSTQRVSVYPDVFGGTRDVFIRYQQRVWRVRAVCVGTPTAYLKGIRERTRSVLGDPTTEFICLFWVPAKILGSLCSVFSLLWQKVPLVPATCSGAVCTAFRSLHSVLLKAPQMFMGAPIVFGISLVIFDNSRSVFSEPLERIWKFPQRVLPRGSTQRFFDFRSVFPGFVKPRHHLE